MKGDDQGAYFHPKFQRNRKELIAEIRRLPAKASLLTFEQVISANKQLPALRFGGVSKKKTLSAAQTAAAAVNVTPVTTSRSRGSKFTQLTMSTTKKLLNAARERVGGAHSPAVVSASSAAIVSSDDGYASEHRQRIGTPTPQESTSTPTATTSTSSHNLRIKVKRSYLSTANDDYEYDSPGGGYGGGGGYGSGSGRNVKSKGSSSGLQHAPLTKSRITANIGYAMEQLKTQHIKHKQEAAPVLATTHSSSLPMVANPPQLQRQITSSNLLSSATQQQTVQQQPQQQQQQQKAFSVTKFYPAGDFDFASPFGQVQVQVLGHQQLGSSARKGATSTDTSACASSPPLSAPTPASLSSSSSSSHVEEWLLSSRSSDLFDDLIDFFAPPSACNTFADAATTDTMGGGGNEDHGNEDQGSDEEQHFPHQPMVAARNEVYM